MSNFLLNVSIVLISEIDFLNSTNNPDKTEIVTKIRSIDKKDSKRYIKYSDWIFNDQNKYYNHFLDLIIVLHTSNFQNNQLDDTIKSIESDFKEDGKLWTDDIIKLILRHTVENMTFLFQDLYIFICCQF